MGLGWAAYSSIRHSSRKIGRASDRFDAAGGFTGLWRSVRTGAVIDHIYAGTATGAHIAEYLFNKMEETRSPEKRRHLEWQRAEILSGAAWEVRISDRTGALSIVVDPDHYSQEALAYLQEQEETARRRAEEKEARLQQKAQKRDEKTRRAAENAQRLADAKARAAERRRELAGQRAPRQQGIPAGSPQPQTSRAETGEASGQATYIGIWDRAGEPAAVTFSSRDPADPAADRGAGPTLVRGRR